MAIKKFALAMIFMGVASTAFASGASGGFRGSSVPTPRPVDPLYEQGKAVYSGKVRSYGRIKYCIASPGQDAGGKLQKKTLKAYKRSSANEFALSLYNCDQPDQRIVDVLERSDLNAVVYYLNKRYKLNLTA